ncbi:hypothetical protein QYE76_004992 [Lolium multiflorum]|uniref:Uncharacterized protein n=1 Tax=Lolium multiflorum TaxID=4521 RepID=A0AAD8W0R3_LOLMU|nr:hypothetical protein QYE76_004992 [Lolium multiflorum]
MLGGPRPLSPPFLRVLLRPENLSHRGILTKGYSRLCGAESTREKRALRAGIRRGNSLPEGEIDAIAIVIELDIISIIIIIVSTIYTAITTAAPRHRFADACKGYNHNESFIETACQHLLLLVGFDTLIYRKYYDTPPILVGHQWLREDEEFAAVSRRNMENRGTGGTHCAGNRDYTRYKGKMVAEAAPGVVLHDAQIYDMMRTKKKPNPALPQPQYYGNAKAAKEDYCDMVKSRHPEVDDPLSIPVDEESLVLSGRGRPHGRYPFLNKAVKPTPATSYTRLKHTLTADSPQPRPRPARPPTYDPEFEAAFEACNEAYQQAAAQWNRQNTAYMAYIGEMMISMSTGTPPPARVTVAGDMPIMPSKAAFAATYYGSTPEVSSLPNRCCETGPAAVKIAELPNQMAWLRRGLCRRHMACPATARASLELTRQPICRGLGRRRIPDVRRKQSSAGARTDATSHSEAVGVCMVTVGVCRVGTPLVCHVARYTDGIALGVCCPPLTATARR